jgi:hypothetical protein
MSNLEHRLATLGRHPGPWTLAGGPDDDFDEIQRNVHQALLTDTNLLTCFRRRFPECGDLDYDEMVRCLDYVWDCPHDRTANVTGYCCAECGRTRASATGRDPVASRGHPHRQNANRASAA